MTEPRRGYVEGGRATRLFFTLTHRLTTLLRRPRPFPPACSRLVVVKLGGVGDAVLATPVLAPLQKRFPDARIDVVCWTAAAGVFRANPAVAEVVTSPLLDADGIVRLARGFRPGELSRLRAFLRGADAILFLNRICTIGGFLKLLLLSQLARPAVRVGLDTDGRRGAFLDLKVRDEGYLVQHEVAYVQDLLKALGIDLPLERLTASIPVSAADCSHVDGLLSPLEGRPFAALHIGSSKEGWRALKRLPLDVWLELAGKLARTYGLAIVLVGAPEDRDINARFLARAQATAPGTPPVLDLGDRTTLPQLVELVSRARLFVGTDSGVAHAAACAGTPLLTVFLFSDFVGFAPWGKGSRVFARRRECGPCLYWEGYATCLHRECSRITPEELFDAAAAALEASGCSPQGDDGMRGQ